MNITSKWLLAGIIGAIGTHAVAQDQQQQSQQQPSQQQQLGQFGQENAQAGPTQDGIVMRDGSVYFIKNGQPQRIEKETRLSEGIVVDEDGNVTLKDGTKTKLTDNQMVTLDGQLKIAPPAMGQRGAFQSPSPSNQRPSPQARGGAGR